MASFPINHPLNFRQFLGAWISLYKKIFFPAVFFAFLAYFPNLVISAYESAEGDEFKYLTLIVLLPWIFLSCFCEGVLYKACSQSCLGLSQDWQEATRSGFKNILKVLGATLILALWIFLCMLCFIIPGVIATINCTVIFPVMFTENLGINESWARSKDLAMGNKWRVLGYLLLLVLVNVIVFSILYFVEQKWDVSSNVTSLINIPLAVLAPALITVLYFDLRARKEIQT